MERRFEYSEETIQTFQELVEEKEIRLNGIKDLSVTQLQAIGSKLDILHGKKSGEVLKNDLINLSNIFLGGQVAVIDLFN